MGNLKIEAGKFYRTRDRRKVGPMGRGAFGGFYDRSSLVTRQRWNNDGSFIEGRFGKLDLVAEWTDAPVAEQPVAKFNVGDRVRVTTTRHGTNQYGKTGVIRNDRYLGGDLTIEITYDDPLGPSGLSYNQYSESDLELLPPKEKPTAIVCLIEDGQPKPAERPHVHATEAAASIEAKRLAGVHKGKKFGVYVLSGTHEQAKPVYQHQWQRLAANGEKINAIRELRSITGMQLKPAKDVVEGFIGSPYGAIAA